MCVILIANEHRPTEEQVTKAYNANRAGAGIAWREAGKVCWEKGLDEGTVQDLIKEVPLPFVAHFRIPTCGGPIPALCHPFPVSADVSLALKGEYKGYVLFHNGHWTRWKDTVLESACRNNLNIPGGAWSDSRAMAWMAYHHSPGALAMIDEKCVVFGPEDMDIIGLWKKIEVDSEDKSKIIWASNDYWDTRTMQGVTVRYPKNGCGMEDSEYNAHGGGHMYTTAPASMIPRRVPPDDKDDDKGSGGNPTPSNFRAHSQIVRSGGNHQGSMAAGEEGTEQASEEVKGTVIVFPDDEELEAFRWARGLNPRGVRGNHRMM